MKHDPHSRKRLGPGAAVHFDGETLFHRIARAVCRADCLPRKELYESWEVARRARRRFHGGRTVDLACGHGLVAHMMTLIDPTADGAIGVDLVLPPSATKLTQSLSEDWPRLSRDVTLVQGELEDVELRPTDVVVSAHACGGLTDLVLERAMSAGARVVVLPCCHPHDAAKVTGLEGWLDPALALDVMRAERLRRAGYAVHTQHVPVEITPKNRLLFGAPARDQPASP